MTSNGQTSNTKELFRREIDAILRTLPDLESARKKASGWNEFGEMIATRMERDRGGRPGPYETLWQLAKRTVHLAMTGDDAETAALRTRILSFPAVSALVLADLSLWLAGKLGVTIFVTRRLVAAMLLGLAESEGDWNTLAD